MSDCYDNLLFYEIQYNNNNNKNKKCLNCVHRQRWECNSKVIQYCGIKKSNRTQNGLLKIKCNTDACELFKEMEVLK